MLLVVVRLSIIVVLPVIVKCCFIDGNYLFISINSEETHQGRRDRSCGSSVRANWPIISHKCLIFYIFLLILIHFKAHKNIVLRIYIKLKVAHRRYV